MATGIGSSTAVTLNWINESFSNGHKEQKMHRFLPNKITLSLLYVNRLCLHAQSTIKDPSSATTMTAKQKHPAEADRKRLFLYEFTRVNESVYQFHGSAFHFCDVLSVSSLWITYISIYTLPTWWKKKENVLTSFIIQLYLYFGWIINSFIRLFLEKWSSIRWRRGSKDKLYLKLYASLGITCTTKYTNNHFNLTKR